MISGPSRPQVLLVEGKVQVRLRLAGLLQEANLTVLPVASAEEALEVLGAVSGIQAVITNVDLPSTGMMGLELACKVHEEHESTGVVLFGPALPKEGLPFGILFLAEPVHPPTLIGLVHHVVGSHQPSDPSLLPDRVLSVTRLPPRPQRADRALTPRQRDILELLGQGKCNRDIAQALKLSENTIKVHLSAIFRVLRVSSRTEAALAADRLLAMTGRPKIRSEVNVALNRLVREGVLESFKTNFDAEHIPGWVPEITIMISETADLASALEQLDAAVRPM